jgi:hypothetical protein
VFKFRTPKRKKNTDRKEGDARKALLEELFYDFYQNRRQVYWMNFVRGIFFGFGSLLGGTIVVATVVWVLGQVTGFFPPLQDAVDTLSTSVSASRD